VGAVTELTSLHAACNCKVATSSFTWTFREHFAIILEASKVFPLWGWLGAHIGWVVREVTTVATLTSTLVAVAVEDNSTGIPCHSSVSENSGAGSAHLGSMLLGSHRFFDIFALLHVGAHIDVNH
jgi:hypothetical protein